MTTVSFQQGIRLAATIWLASVFFRAADAAAPSVHFAKHIAPILEAHCHRCHNERSRKGELDLSSVVGLQRGGESGAVVEPGDPDASRLYEVVHSGEMPPDDGDRPSAEQVDLIREWIKQGARWGGEFIDAPKSLNQHDVLPILLLRCAACHGRQKQEAGLDLRSRASMLQGGQSGPAIVPGDAGASLIVQKIKAEAMPPRSQLASHSVKPVEESELSRLVEWIEQGAYETDALPDAATGEPDPLVSDEDRQFWSFRTPGQTPLPEVDGSVLQPIDNFIKRRLEDAGLEASQQAARHVLIRRAYFDLLGLPPSPDAVESFIADSRPGAYERLIDRLLASPRYGERWGQYWLDIAGYSDSEGVQHSDPIRPHAYRYRDYVIRSFNADKSYDRFLLEQLAGDELEDIPGGDVVSHDQYENLVATGFLRMTADGTFAGITGFVPNRLDVIDDQLRVLSSAVLGLTVRCARCHSHKFDPIPQRDYYRLVALFKPALDEHDWLKPVTGGGGNTVGNYRYLPLALEDERTAWKQQQARMEELKSLLEQQKNDEQLKAATEKKLKELEAQAAPEPMIRALWDRGEPSPTYLLRRGDYLQPGRLVGPGVPSVLTDGRTPFEPEPPWPGASKTGNRLRFARWLTKPNHPLTARVIVNRVWKHHFGRGIVETLDDFGRAGAKPSHPELLDWLAVDFAEHGWSIKRLHRLIMTSATYRQASDVRERHRHDDPENRLLSRMPLRRMEAEVLRDTLLSVAGQLDLNSFGRPDDVNARDDGLVVSASRPQGRRRSIYVLKRRTQRLTILNNFDRPAMSPNCVTRTVSTVAPQALYMMNNKMVHELSVSLADRVLAEATEDNIRIERLFMIAIGRTPDAEEREAAEESLERLRTEWRKELFKDRSADNDDGGVDRRAFGNLCHAMMNSAAFMYVE